MADFTIHSLLSAPAESTAGLAIAKDKYGFIPNLLATLAESPTALNAYLRLGDLFEKTSFSPLERQVVLLVVSFENRCNYCMAAHSTVAIRLGLPRDLVAALRDGQPLPDGRLETLRRFTANLVRKRGWVPQSEIDEFVSAGFTRAQALEVLLGVTYKTLSNYTNHLARTPLDPPFKAQAWTPKELTTSA